MSEHIKSVNRVAQLYRNGAKEVAGALRAQRKETAEQLEAASAELARLYALTSALPPDLGNIYDLPPELQQELSITKTDALEDQLVTVINAYGGAANLDQILVGLFRKFKISQKRRFLQNKLYRMTAVWSVPGKKGLYTTQKPESDQHTETTADINPHQDLDPSPSLEDDVEIPF